MIASTCLYFSELTTKNVIMLLSPMTDSIGHAVHTNMQEPLDLFSWLSLALVIELHGVTNIQFFSVFYLPHPFSTGDTNGNPEYACFQFGTRSSRSALQLLIFQSSPFFRCNVCQASYRSLLDNCSKWRICLSAIINSAVRVWVGNHFLGAWASPP